MCAVRRKEESAIYFPDGEHPCANTNLVTPEVVSLVTGSESTVLRIVTSRSRGRIKITSCVLNAENPTIKLESETSRGSHRVTFTHLVTVNERTTEE